MASVCKICSPLNCLQDLLHEWSCCGTTDSFSKLLGRHSKLSSWRRRRAQEPSFSFAQASKVLNVKCDTRMRKKTCVEVHFGQHGWCHSVSRPPACQHRSKFAMSSVTSSGAKSKVRGQHNFQVIEFSRVSWNRLRVIENCSMYRRSALKAINLNLCSLWWSRFQKSAAGPFPLNYF